MTTKDPEIGHNTEVLTQNLAKIEELSQRLINAIGNKRAMDPNLQGPGQDLYMKAAAAYWAGMMANPAKMIESQVAYWGETLNHFIKAQELLAEGKSTEAVDDGPPDPRFSNPMWRNHPYFNFIRQQYQSNAAAIENAVHSVEGLDEKDSKRLEYFSRQIIDMMSPTNFLATNPDALARAVETEGQSLVDGLENLIHDLETNDGDLMITLADKDAFKVGKDLATTEGAVIFRTKLFELIQYSPTTEKVHAKPLIIFPPWINKFYILDLKAQNSLIKWIVDQGFTLFVVSWANPDASFADFGMDSYVAEGYLVAIEEVKKITGQKSVNVAGYCIAGTTLALTLSLLAKRKDKSINSATFFTTLTDFSDQGEFQAFLDDGFVDGIEKEVTEHGYLDKFFMARTFSFLRANDLIYSPAIRNYMMGEAPPAFDLLFWNGDGTNLPARMAVEYLRWLCQQDRFASGCFQLFDETLDIADVKVPLCAIACETDHIAAWKSSYEGIQKMGSKDKTFILSESGHIAGIINPPTKDKYGHFTNVDMAGSAEEWRDGAEFHKGSWWPRWNGWLAKRSGKMVPARQPGDSEHKVLAPAPGTYVTAVPNT